MGFPHLFPWWTTSFQADGGITWGVEEAERNSAHFKVSRCGGGILDYSYVQNYLTYYAQASPSLFNSPFGGTYEFKKMIRCLYLQVDRPKIRWFRVTKSVMFKTHVIPHQPQTATDSPSPYSVYYSTRLQAKVEYTFIIPVSPYLTSVWRVYITACHEYESSWIWIFTSHKHYSNRFEWSHR